MSMNFCPNCGNKMDGDEQFCPNCGTRLMQAQPAPQPAAPQPAAPQYAAPQPAAPQPAAPQYAVPQPAAPQYAAPQQAYSPAAIGFSDRINDPEITARTEKNRKAGGRFMLFILPLPIIAMYVYALVSRDMEPGQALTIGAVISAVILVFSLISRSKQSAKNAYEATVIDKRQETVRTNDDDQTTYITVVRTTDGKTKKIRETGIRPGTAYDYLNTGDRFRYHPQLAFPYEKYDKTRDGFVYCACCTAKNDLSGDRCCKCGVPLLK